MAPPQDPQPPTVPGIDSADLLERIGGDRDLYWEVLGELSDSYRDAAAQIALALDRDPAAAKHLAHTLKGVLGNLSAVELFPIAAELHEAIRDDRLEPCPGLLERLGTGLPALCDAIAAARPDRGGAAGGGGAVDPDQLAERYGVLAQALAGHRARDCKALAAEIAALDLPAAERSFFDRLDPLIRSYRFAEAEALIARRPHD
jgi:HPt (histidine-containing phosphotransfer) domain-containing protein